MFKMTQKALIGALACVGFFASAEQTVEKDWTILVFLNGNNNLDYFGKQDMNEMERVGSTDRVNVVAQWASYGNRKTKRILVQKDEDMSNVTSPVIQDMGLVDMGSVDELVAFAKWGMENYPAKHYFIDIWNHGNGWQKNGIQEIFKDVSYDDFSGNKITTEQLGTAMAQVKEFIGRNVDILGFDACLMAMSEVGGEIADSTDFLIGSEDLEPGDGWPYDDFLMKLNEGAVYKDPRALSADLVSAYVTSYSGGSQGNTSVTLSAHDLGALRNMYPSISNLATALNQIAETNPAALKDAIRGTLGFYGSDYKDLGSFIAELQTRNTGIDANVLQAVSTQLKTAVVANQATGNFARAQGMSLWIPGYASSSWSRYSERYKGFLFDQETSWSKWIETLASKDAE
ncbi:MAG: clostripain-related cysteine peptidase [Bdellovibrionota bacterium]